MMVIVPISDLLTKRETQSGKYDILLVSWDSLSHFNTPFKCKDYFKLG